MKIEDLKDKKILILGFGAEGKDTYLALKKLFPEKVIGIADQFPTQFQIINKNKTNLHFGGDYLKAIKNYDLIIKTPGIPPGKIKPFLKKGAVVTSQTEIFFDSFPGLIVGITGTKGKGTTSSLIYHILKKAKLKVWLGGNIGQPVLQKLLTLRQPQNKNYLFVYELSSHQLQGLKKSPQIAVFLNLFPDHLDYYKDFQEYQEAKENIVKHQKKDGWFIYNANDPIVRKIARKASAKKVPLTLRPLPTRSTRSLNNCYQGYVKGGWVFFGKERVIREKEIPLKGKFNQLNVVAALSVAKILNVPNKIIERAIKSFKPLPHRLEFVGKFKGIEFYNDSMSTIPEVTIAALSALGEKVKTLIAGGSDKGSDYTAMAKKILKNRVRTLLLLSPGTGERLWQKITLLRKKNLPEAIFINSMEEAIKIAYQKTRKGEICLLSPGAASFNLFRDYKKRGELFKKFVKKYAKR